MRRNIRRSINVGFLIIIVLLWGIGVYSMMISLDIERLFVGMKENNFPQAVIISKTKSIFSKISQYTFQYAFTGNNVFDGRELSGWLNDGYMDINALHNTTYLSVVKGTRFEKTYYKLMAMCDQLADSSKDICYLKDQGEPIDEKLHEFYVLLSSSSNLIGDYEDLLADEMAELEENIGLNNNLRLIKIMIFCLLATGFSLLIAFLVDKLYRQYIYERDQARRELQHTNMDLTIRNAELEKTFYFISHDLKNPVFMIQGLFGQIKSHMGYIFSCLQEKDRNVSMISELNSVYKPKISGAAEYIQESLDKINYILNGVHKLSRLGRFGNKVVFTMERLSMNELMLEMVSKFRGVLDTRDIQLKIDDLPECLGDKTHLIEVFSCLLDNAIKHLPHDKKGKIHISGYSENDNSIYMIEDNGPGIARENHREIFGVFHKGNTQSGNGLGLGLAIALKIIEKHKGHIWVESDGDEGSQFFVSLPQPTD